MTDILAALHQAADLLEIAGANPFRVNAFRRGARALRPLAKEGVLEERSAAGTLTQPEPGSSQGPRGGSGTGRGSGKASGTGASSRPGSR